MSNLSVRGVSQNTAMMLPVAFALLVISDVLLVMAQPFHSRPCGFAVAAFMRL